MKLKFKKEKLLTRKMGIDEEKYHVVNGMKEFGGSFVKALGEALSHADVTNTEKIKETWPEYWKQYLEMGEKND